MVNESQTPIYGFVYKIVNTINGKMYVGQHMGVEFGDYWGSGLILNRAYAVYGKAAFKREIIQYASTKEELNALERFYIKELNTLKPNGYNIATGGTGGFTGVPTEEARRNISKGLKGKKKSLEHRQHLSEARKGISHPHSEETKKKISASHMGIEPWNKGKGKPVEQLSPDGKHIKTWGSLTEAEQHGFNKSKISECIHGTRKMHRQYLWRSANGY